MSGTTLKTGTEGGWQLEGSAAGAYQAYLVPAIFDAMSRRLVAAAGVRPGHAVLDVGCGTGVVARAAARVAGPDGAVTGIDVNPEMLATADRASPDTGIHWERADATALPFPDDTFDVVLCEEVLQFLDDRVTALEQMRRVAVPGGTVALSVLRGLDHNPPYATFVRALERHAGPEAARMMASPFALGDAGTLRREAEAAGLRDVEIRIAVSEERFPSVAEMVRREAASSPLAGPLGALDDGARDALVAAMEEALAEHTDDAGVAFHNETHLVTARA